jgi:rRNA biogenesis protein RRP5
MEVEFPRGGKTLLTPLEVRNTRLQAERDVLFEEKESRKNEISVSDQMVGAQEVGERKRQKSKKKKKTIGDVNVPDEENPAKRVKKSVDTLTFKKLQTGNLLLGAVKEVSDYDATVSLPSGLSGFIHASNISTILCHKMQEIARKEDSDENIKDNDEQEDDIPKLSDVLHVGNLVPCYVQNISSSPTSHHRIQLSTDPELINLKLKSTFVCPDLVLPGCVTSVEEHGYLISFGIKGRSGFLLNKRARKYIKDSNDGKPLFVGQVIACLVLPYEPPELKTVPVTVNFDEVSKSLMNEDMMLSMSMLIPGMLVNAIVTEVLNDGLTVSFLGGFTGTVSINHLSGDHIATEHYKRSQKVKGRIIFVDPSTKSVGVSLKKSVVENRAETFEGLSVGDIVENAKVLRVNPELGLVMQLDGTHKGFVHISRVSDDHIEKLQGKKYKVMSAHTCRILGFNTLEGMATLSMQKSVLERVFLRYADIEIGSVISGVVHSVESFGVVITVTDHIRGLCPLMHLSDVRLKHPEKKFKEKKKMKFRVLEVNPSRHKLILSHKKTLLQSKYPALCHKTDAVIGGIYHGTVVSIRHYGCIVAFYGDVKGLLHKTELG